MLKFFAGTFAVAGLIAAGGPLIIHLLNRRRFRRVEWAAMDFLRKAMQRSRRAVELRDLIVLVLRCLAVALFGVALARPFLSGVAVGTILAIVLVTAGVIAAVGSAAAGILTSKKQVRNGAFLLCGLCAAGAAYGLFNILQNADETSLGTLASRQPVHAILLVDNSMSMGYESLEGTLLDRARTKAIEFLDALPVGSQFHVIPLCETDAAAASSAYRSRGDAHAALERVQVVDRAARAGFAFDLATEASRQVPELPAKRIVLLSDQQASLWTGGTAGEQLKTLPDVQIMRIAPEQIENVAVTDFFVQDGVADTETPAAFLATVRNFGNEALHNVQISLAIDGSDVASQLVDLEPGQIRQVEFRQRIDNVSDTGALGGAPGGASAATFVNATVTVIPEGGVGDRLARDNARHLVVPVVAGLPVVFVDQYGDTEDFERGEIGESYRLRRLLAPHTATDDEQNRQLIRVRHVAIDRLNQELLSDARLVVIAGVESPGDTVPLLRQYVEQGGPLVIAAGANFDANAWQTAGWLDGAGILPAPLSGEPVGQLPEVAVGTLDVFRLDFRSMQHDFFQIEGEAREALEDLYQQPLFFKAVGVEMDDATLTQLVTAETERIEAAREFLNQSASQQREWDQQERVGTLDERAAADRQINLDERRQVRPDWLQWAEPDALARLDEVLAATVAEQSRPRVLARYELDGRPFLIERTVGAGRLLFVTSGLYSSWNTLTGTNAILMFDRMLRQLLEQTLPERNFETGDVVTLPAQRSDVLREELQMPGGTTEPLAVEALSADRFGLRVSRAMQNGHYSVRTFDTSGEEDRETSTVALSFNCPPQESELSTIDALEFRQRTGDSDIRWLEADESFSLEGAKIQGRDIWKWLISTVMIFLLAEMLILAWPQLRHPDAAAT